MEPVKQKDLEALQEFLGWLSDLYDDDTLGLIACDGELRQNFAKVRKTYPAVLARLTADLIVVGSLVERLVPMRCISAETGVVVELLECGLRARVRWDPRPRDTTYRTSKIKLVSLKFQ